VVDPSKDANFFFFSSNAKDKVMSGKPLATKVVPSAAAELEPLELEPRFIAPDDWDELASRFRDVLHEQTQCFNALRWAAHRLERIAFYKDGELASGVVVLVFAFPFVGSGIAFVKWGPLWRLYNSTFSAEEEKRILIETIRLLQRIYTKERGFYLTFYPRADPEISDFEVETFQSFGFTPGETLSAPDRYFVDTSTSIDEIRASLTVKWRYNLKQSEKAGVSARVVSGEEGLQIFKSLYAQMLERKGFHDTSAVGTLEGLLNAKEAAFRPLIIVAEHEGKPVSAGVTDISGERAISLYAATNDRALPLKAGYSMHWAFVTYLSSVASNRWYDLGGADEDTQLHHFKNGLVGKAGKRPATPAYYNYGYSWKARLFGPTFYLLRRLKGKVERKLHDLRT